MGKEWFESFFSNDYWLVYAALDSEEKTAKEVQFIENALCLGKNDKILDLCCGYGRHSIQLSKKGYELVGYDLSKDLLKKARLEAKRLGVDCCFVNGDSRKLPFKNESFDKALNFKTSFGFFAGQNDDYKMLKEASRVLKTGGLFLLDTKSKTQAIKHLNPLEQMRVNSIIIENKQRLDSKTDCIITDIKLVFPNGELKRHTVRNRFYPRKTLEKMFKKAGFSIQQVYGRYSAEKPGNLSPRMIFVSKKVGA